MQYEVAPVTIAGRILEGNRHVCGLFDNDADEQAVLLPFATETIAADERLVVAIGTHERLSYVAQLEAAGLDVDALVWSQQLLFVDRDMAYIPNGTFDPPALLGRLVARFRESSRLGFRRTRFLGRAEWVLGKPPGLDSVPLFEAMLTNLLGETGHVAVCVYRTDRVNPRRLVDAIRAHPSAVLGRNHWTNPTYPFFVPTEEPLTGLRPDPGSRERRRARSSGPSA